jgi:NAD(P)-dependent dehydrogenase (short-subunit alcohol dehydrogenase family)
MLLENKISVVAGNAFDIGRASALLFAAEGALSIWIDRASQDADSTAQLRALGVRYFQADVSDSAQVQAIAQRIGSEFDRLDVLFNVAGSDPIKQSFEETSEDTWSEMIDRNLTSGFLCAKYFLPQMKRAGSGSIINHASIDSLLGNPSLLAYSAAKGGVLPMTRVMAHNLAPHRIRVNSIATGGVRAVGAKPSLRDLARIAVTPSARLGTPEDVAKVALFLASDLASFVNASHVVVDGGRTAITQGCYDD